MDVDLDGGVNALQLEWRFSMLSLFYCVLE